MLCCTHRRKRVHIESLNYTVRWKDNIKNDHKEVSPEKITGLNFSIQCPVVEFYVLYTFKACSVTALWQNDNAKSDAYAGKGNSG